MEQRALSEKAVLNRELCSNCVKNSIGGLWTPEIQGLKQKSSWERGDGRRTRAEKIALPIQGLLCF